MIDIHAHVLPLVDDGSSSFNHSLEMVKECVNQGVTDVVLTPHYRNPYVHKPSSIKKTFNEFKQKLSQENIPVNVYLGQEVFVSENFLELLEKEQVLLLNDTKYLLVEFSFSEEQEIAEVVYELVLRGYKPIVAHLERYAYADLNLAFDVKNSGGLIQVNAQSVIDLGLFKRSKLVKQLFENDLVDFVASDVHYRRANYMLKAYNKVLKKYGDKTAQKVFVLNAQEIIKG